jgi:DNA-binding response OmpR family regulator
MLGQLTVKDGAIISWNGVVIDLSPSERLIVMALVKADGAPVKRHILAEATGYEGDNPTGCVAVFMHRIIRSFLAIDPTFSAIENVWGVGVRWRTDQQHLLAA